MSRKPAGGGGRNGAVGRDYEVGRDRVAPPRGGGAGLAGGRAGSADWLIGKSVDGWGNGQIG